MLQALRRLTTGRPPAPSSPRELLQALVRYDRASGLEHFLDRFDFTGVRPHQIYYSVLGRLPESARVATMPSDYDPRRHLRETLLSPEFQSGLLARVLAAFPEKHRLFFVHVPKCAGSDLGSHLMQRYDGAYLGQLDQNPLHLLPELLPWRLQILMAGLARHDTLALVGHFSLAWLLDEHLLRYGDTAFSVLRDPVDIAISKANYVLTSICRSDDAPAPDVRGWIEQFGLRAYAGGGVQDPAELQAATLRLLRDPRLAVGNTLCRFLGRGDADSALDLCAAADLELTTVSRYPAWLHQRWGVADSRRLNESRKFLDRTSLSSADLDYLNQINDQDLRLYQRVERRLQEQGGLSVTGAAL
ncbi:MAG: hypothetical protein Q8Q73_10135 [Stagnimonas sp.]|nr:hypothetical protein [Stagnimonas sp.]